MFVSKREDELRDKLRNYIANKLVTEEVLALDIGIEAKTVLRFLGGGPTRKRTLLKIGQFLIERKIPEELLMPKK